MSPYVSQLRPPYSSFIFAYLSMELKAICAISARFSRLRASFGIFCSIAAINSATSGFLLSLAST